MHPRRKLRFRLVLSFALFGFGLTTLFAIASFDIRSRVEDQLVSSSLQQDVNQAVEHAIDHPDEPAHSQLMEAWIKSNQTLYKMPMAWQNLEPGIHDITEIGDDGKLRHYKLAVQRKKNVIGFLRYDVSREDLGDQQLTFALIVTVVLFTLLSLALGVWLSRKVLKPLSQLAVRLSDSRKNGKSEPLATHYSDDEVGALAMALDEYAAQLGVMAEREREFNSDVSHELRTPLAVIASTTELLLDSPDMTEKIRERVKRIERASRQATELIEALLLLVRAERRGPTRGEISEVAKVAADVIESQRPQLRGKPIEVELRITGRKVLTVNAPAVVVSVALTNLIGNAIKYTLAGTVQIDVGDRSVEVIDTGPGIKPEDAQRLFQRGVRGEGVGGSGAGLGLAIVRRLCDLYGWTVSMHPRTDTNGAIARLIFERVSVPPQNLIV
ncbi:sensor histidine kinase [Dyella flagellata]|uniref:sensor histidine kinase n=1 Tax=Dyella flagellata TaxID=1867833 RepID=UPI0024E15E27|nr:sensor histidine kinase [Dyella flagellata]